MIKVLFDTSFWISYFRPRRDDELEIKRNSTANELLDYFLKNRKKYEICYSERTKNELKSDQDKSKLEQFLMVGSHTLNLNWEEIDLKWNNISTKWGDSSEVVMGNNLQTILPDNKKKDNVKDRGIYGDAILEDCKVLIHEDKDFNKFTDDTMKREILLINLNHCTVKDAIKSIDKFTQNIDK